MKLLKRIQTKTHVLYIVFLTLILALIGLGFSHSTARANTDEPEITYIDTDVASIAFMQHPTRVYFGFILTESDYSDFNNWEGDFAGTPAYERYEKYIATELTYWKNFSLMNNEEVKFDQLYAYWSAGLDPLTQAFPLPPSRFDNSVAHRSTLTSLTLGFTISIPAGTTFPSATYVQNGCQGTPVMYRTTQDVAFYYDGSAFQILSYAVAQKRTLAINEVQSVNYDFYREKERAEVVALVEKTSAILNESFTGFAIEDTLLTFYAELDKIMTLADYEVLARKKTEAKTELANFFSLLDQAEYETEDWNKILSIKSEYEALIDPLMSSDEVAAFVDGVKNAVGKVLTKTERVEFSAYQQAAIQRVEDSFVETLYRDNERMQGASFVQEAKRQIESATTKDTVDGAVLTYTSLISELKTQVQWEEEERQESVVDSEEEKESAEESTKKDGGNILGIILGSVGGVLVICAVIIFIIIMKKRKGTQI
ncbi:MAG: hypothetical protein IJY84_02570 [Clostridia bacterium]|nr:hypothetical protein [Clostridia bacterium]